MSDPAHSETSAEVSLWFVYNGMEYYPFAEVVAAKTAEEAAERVSGDKSREPIVVFSLATIAYRSDGDQGKAWLERFDA